MTIRELADVWGVSTEYARRELIPLAGDEHRWQERERSTVYVRGRVVLDAWLANKLEQKAGRRGEPPPASGADGDELVFAGADSPQLERYRKLKADMVQLDLLEREKRLIPRQQVRSFVDELASQFREEGAILQKQLGEDGANFHNERMAEIGLKIARHFGDLDDSDTEKVASDS